jgi:hypothetical protein
MTLSSADIKREILMSAKESIVKKRMENPPGISDGELIDIGQKLEAVTRMAGWTYIESYMLRRMNLVGLALSDKEQPDQKGIAKGFIELMQWIQIAIEKKDEILTKERLKYEAKNVPKDEGE